MICVLEGGQTKEDQNRSEVFYNETLSPDNVDRLLYRSYCYGNFIHHNGVPDNRNKMLCERLAGRTGILLKQKEKQEDFVKYLPVFLKQTIDYIYIRFLTTM